jgi:phage baseplate assembly protein W
MLRDFGGGVHQRLQEPNDGTLRALVHHEIEQALRTFLPEVRLVSPLRLRAEEEVMTVTVDYVADPNDVVRRLELQVP